MKRLLLFQRFFAAVLLLAFSTLSWADKITVDGIKYDAVKEAKQATVIANDYSGEVVIPSSFVYEDVEYSVTSIGGYAFYGCSGLTEVTIPNSVTRIDGRAFYGCSGLTEVTIPNSVTSIGNVAFGGCSGLKSITIPNSVTSIDTHVFWNCTGLESVTLSNSMTNISFQTFYNCTSLKSVTIPNSVTSIAAEAFEYCTNLTSVTIPNSVTSIGESAFSFCSSLTSIEIPKSVATLETCLFYLCTSLKSITIPNSVICIKERAFQDCRSLISVHIPNSVKSIGHWAFHHCKNLSHVYAAHTNATEYNADADIFNDEYGNTPYATLHVPMYCRNNYASVSPWNKLGEIHDDITDTDLTLYKIRATASPSDGGSITGMGNYKYGTSVTLTATPAEGYVLENWTEDGEIVSTQEAYTFTVTAYRTLVANFRNSINGIYYNFDTENKTAVVTRGVSDYTGQIVIPESVRYKGNTYIVTEIENGAFSGYTSLRSITIGNGVTSIGSDAFSGCTGLMSVTIGNSVASIGNKAFYGCSSLSSVTIGNCVAGIGNSAFEDCTSLTSVIIPNSVTSIGQSAFRKCEGLTFVSFGSGVANIGSYAFYDCTALTSVICLADNIPNAGTYCFRNVPQSSGTLYVPESLLGAYKSSYSWNFGTILSISFEENGLVYNINPDRVGVILKSCTSVNSVTGDVVIPSMVQYNGEGYNVIGIGDNAFEGCTDLTAVTVPEYVTSIGEKAFYGCTGLRNVVCQAQKIPTTGSDCFGGIDLSSTTLFVPATYVNKYRSTSPWSSFSTITSITDDFKVWNIKLDKTEILLYEDGNPYQLTASVAPEYAANRTLTWTSSDTSVATVNADGLVTPVNSGTAVITAKTRDGSNLSATCVVTVEVNNVISDVSQLSNNKCYYIYTKDQLRGGLGVNTEYGNLASTFSVTNAKYKTESISPFVFFNYDDKFYLYSVEANAFVTNTGALSRMGVTDANAINITKNTNEYFMISFASTGSILNINTSPGLVINNWGTSSSQYDEGNQFTIEVAGNFDSTAIIDMIKESEDLEKENAEHYAQTPVQGLSELVNAQVYTAVTKRAAWYVPASSTQLESTIVPIGVDLSCRNTGQQFAFILHNGQYYVYCVGEKKILNGRTNKSPNRGILVTEDCQSVSISETNDTQYPLFFSYGTSYNVNIDGSGKVTIDSWSTLDEGNMVALRPVQGVTLSDSEMRRIIGYIDGYNVGDANGNGEVEIGDVTSVLTLMATPEATGYDKKAADANGNGEIEIGDVTTILTIMAGE